MRWILAVTLVTVLVFSGLNSVDAQVQPKGAFQIGVGTAYVPGTAYYMISSYDVFTVQASGLYFPSEWVTLLLDYSYGLPHEYDIDLGDELQQMEVEASYLDVMAGFYTPFNEGGFIYISGGFTVGWGDFDMSGSNTVFEIETAAGVVLGFGVQIPIKNTFGGFANFRQRFINSKVKGDDFTFDMSSGGMEMTVGVAWTFGDKSKGE